MTNNKKVGRTGKIPRKYMPPLFYVTTHQQKAMNYIYLSQIKFHIEAAEIFVDVLKRTSE